MSSTGIFERARPSCRHARRWSFKSCWTPSLSIIVLSTSTRNPARLSQRTRVHEKSYLGTAFPGGELHGPRTFWQLSGARQETLFLSCLDLRDLASTSAERPRCFARQGGGVAASTWSAGRRCDGGYGVRDQSDPGFA